MKIILLLTNLFNKFGQRCSKSVIQELLDSYVECDILEEVSANTGLGIIELISIGGSRPPIVPYQPPHWGESWFDASTLPISLLPQ